MAFDEFMATYESKLGQDGGVTIALASRDDHPGHPKAAANSFVRSLHMSALGERWIDPQWDIRHHLDSHCGDPDGHLAARLQRRIDSTDNRPWFTVEVARQIAGDFYGMFDLNCAPDEQALQASKSRDNRLRRKSDHQGRS